MNVATLNEKIIHDGLAFGSPLLLACTEFPKEDDDFGCVGTPVIRLSDERELILSQVYYRDDQMWVTTSDVKHPCECTEWKLADLDALAPKMIGVTFSQYDKVSAKSVERGYILFDKRDKPSLSNQAKQKMSCFVRFWQRLTGK